MSTAIAMSLAGLLMLLGGLAKHQMSWRRPDVSLWQRIRLRYGHPRRRW